MMRAGLVVAVLVAGSVLSAQAPQAPHIVNGRVASGAGDLAAAIAAVPAGPSDVTWLAYAVAAEGRSDRCCWNNAGGAGACCQACRLEPGRGAVTALAAAGSPDVPVPLEPAPDRAIVLVRMVGGGVDRIRVFSPSCTLDAGGRLVRWLPDVTPAGSVAWLHGQTTSASRRVSDDALMALAAHAAPAALDRLLATAQSGTTPRLRSQALFWLAQRAGDRAAGAISRAIDQDPDTDVKRQAVFALSQLPDGEGVSRLIDLARSHSNQAVRKQAFFWLGQSHDPRALAFFAEILKR